MIGQTNPNLGLFRALRGRGRPGDFMALCPAHRDVNPSLHVTIKNGTTLLYCHAGCSQDAVIVALRDKGLWEQPHPRTEARAGEVVKTYDYASADGELMHQTLRLQPKGFRQRRPAPQTGWIWGLTAGGYMRAACERAGIEPPISFHALRHSWASLAVMAGMPLMVVAKNLGHSSTRMVESHYGHLAPSFVAEEIRRSAPKFGFRPGKVIPLK